MGRLKITESDSGHVLYNTHDEILLDANPKSETGRSFGKPSEPETCYIERNIPFEQPGFELGELFDGSIYVGQKD